MPDWKRGVGRRLDELVHTVPDVRKAVKWNSPFYGIEGQLDEAQLAAWVKQASQLPGWGKA